MSDEAIEDIPERPFPLKGKAFLNRGQSSDCANAPLIPVGGARPVIVSPVRMAVLNGHPDRLPEGNGIENMVAIVGDLLSPVDPTSEYNAVVGS